jgi:hypothetical protein
VQYKLLHAQTAILLSSVIWVFLIGRTAGSTLFRGIALWTFFSTLYLHRVGASLVRASTTTHGTAGARRNVGALLVFGAAAAAVLWAVFTALPALRNAAQAGLLGDALIELLRGPTFHVVLFPFQLLLAPVFASSSAEWWRAMIPVVAILIAHYWWILRQDTAFEEAAADAAQKRAALLAAARARGVRRATEPRLRGQLRIPLAPTGRPSKAILWKNTLALIRTISMSVIIGIVISAFIAIFVVFEASPTITGMTDAVGTAALILAGMLITIGPLWIRNDLRLDLLRLDLLRAYPLRGTTIVRSEITSAAASLTAIQLLLVLLAYLIIPIRGTMGYTFSDRTALLMSLVLLLPIVNGMGITIQNTAALLFPAWVRLGITRPSGVEAMGQNILTAAGSVLGLGLLLALPALVGGVAAALGFPTLGFWGILPGAILATGVALGELWMLTAWLGRVFERTEPTEIEGVS